MHIREKALYNLLRLNWLKDPSLRVEPWQVADYRSFEVKELFNALKEQGISLDEERFVAYAQEVGDPEELAELLWTPEDAEVEAQDRVYLLLFELWRRLLPEKETLTLFCDELDHQIYSFVEMGKIDEIDELLVRLEDILDSYVDSGENPRKIFQTISDACAYDVEAFLYEYILELIHAGEEMFASELLDGFSEYVADLKRFEFLRIRLFAKVDPVGTVHLLTELVQSLKKGEDFHLLLEIGAFLICFGQDPLYKKLIVKGLNWMQTEEDFAEILSNIEDYFCCLDQEEKQRAIQAVQKKREEVPFDAPLDPADPAIAEIKNLLINSEIT